MIKDDFSVVKMTLPQLQQHITDFLKSADEKSKETRGTYQRALRSFVDFFVLDRNFFYRVRDVERYKKYLQTTRKLQPISVATYMTSLRRLCNYFVETGILEKNPAKRVEGGSRPKSHNRTFLTLEEIDILLDSIDATTTTGLRDRAMIRLMLGCALSELEITRATVGDLNRDGNRATLKVQGKGKGIKDETVPIPTDTLEAIDKYLADRGEVSPESPLFVSYSNRTKNAGISIRGMRETITDHLTGSGIKRDRDLKLTPFSLRHTAGILLVESGATVEEVMQRMRIEWRPTAMLYFKQKGKLHSEDRKDAENFMALAAQPEAGEKP